MVNKGDKFRNGYEIGIKEGYRKAKEEEQYWKKRYERVLSWLHAHNFGWIADHAREAVEEEIEIEEIEFEEPADQKGLATVEEHFLSPETEKEIETVIADKPPRRVYGDRELELDEETLFSLMGW